MKIESMDAANLQVLKTQYKDYQPNTVNSSNNFGKEASNEKKRMWMYLCRETKAKQVCHKGQL